MILVILVFYGNIYIISKCEVDFMKRATFIRILTGIKLVSNNVSSVENFKNRALVSIRVPEILGESPKQIRSFQKVLSRSNYYNIKPEGNELIITLEFEWT